MDRIDLGLTEHKVHRYYVRGRQGDIGHALLAYGQINSSGDWFIAKAERGINMAWIAYSEAHALERIQAWIRQRGGPAMWEEVWPIPARPAAAGPPPRKTGS